LQYPCFADIFCQPNFTSAWYIILLWLMPLFGNHGVTHPTSQRRSAGSAGLSEALDPHQASRNLLLVPLMRPRLIEVYCLHHEKPAELLLMENEEVVQTFSPDASQKAFADGICPARVLYGVRFTLMPLVSATCVKIGPNLRSLSRMRYFGTCPYGVASRSGTRSPLIGRRARHIDMDDFPRFQFTYEEGKKRTEEKVCHLQEITSPYLCRMNAEKGLPALSMGSKWRDSASYTFE
jgi:hypothetical protein